MAELTKDKLQLYAVIVIIVVWVIALFLIPAIGNTLVAVMTPIMTTTLGWLFTSKASGG